VLDKLLEIGDGKLLIPVLCAFVGALFVKWQQGSECYFSAYADKNRIVACALKTGGGYTDAFGYV
jgi:hypothetical protein